MISDLDIQLGKLGKKKLPTFLRADALPDLILAANNDVLDEVAVRGVVQAFVKKNHDLYTHFSSLFVAESADRFALAAMGLWGDSANFHRRYAWMLELIATLGGDRTALALERHVQSWQTRQDTWRKRAIEAMYVFERIDTPTSLMALVGLTQRQERPSVYEAAVSQLTRAARRRDMTWEELSDAVVPSCGLDARGTRIFELGHETMKLILDEDFTPRLRAEDYSLHDTIPPREAPEHEELHARAVADWELIQQQLEDVLDIQTRRMEQCMLVGRRWNVASWKAHILAHPLMINFARRLVWGAFDAKGELIKTFRATEDHSLVDVEDEEVELEESLSVGLLHPAQMPRHELQPWAQSFAEYELFSPFQQLDRGVIKPPAEALEGTRYEGFAGFSFDGSTLRRVMKEQVWRRPTGGGMRRMYFYKEFTDEGVRAYVDLSPGLMAGADGWDEPQQIPSVRFEKIGRARGQELKLRDVSLMVFSEACRFVEMVKAAQPAR